MEKLPILSTCSSLTFISIRILVTENILFQKLWIFTEKAAAYLNRTLTPENFPFYIEILKSEKKRAWNRYGMVLISGFEITKNSFSNHRSAHIIGLGIS